MPDLGVLEITVGQENLGTPRTVSQQQLPAGAYLRVSIKDHGVGIDAETRAHMFEPFFTTKGAGRGTGLGLSLAMSIAKAHGGGIDVISAPGAGATFSVYLPLIAPDDRIASVANAAKILPRGDDARVLLVDDEPALRELAEEILTLLGYQTASYGNSVEALAAFERNPMRFDAVLTDEVMPGISGTQMAGRMHVLRPDLPILIITGFGGPGFELRAQQAGVTTVLRKPYQMSDLAHALDKALHRQRP
jgi:CheY-like chemotaxis protein